MAYHFFNTKQITHLKFAFLLTLFTSLFCVACDIISSPEPDEDPNPSPYRDCTKISDPAFIMKRGGLYGDSTFLHMSGDIYVEVLDHVARVDVSVSGPSFGFSEGHAESYQVTGFLEENMEWLDDTPLWKLPFVVNETNRDYSFEVTYFCDNEEGEPIESHSKILLFNPGDLCDDGGVWTGSEFMSSEPLINGVNTGGMSVPRDSFDFKIKTRLPDGGVGVDMLIFPIEKIESATVELSTKSGGMFSRPLGLGWNITENESFLNSKVNLESLFTKVELESAGAIGFRIKRCGGKEYYTTFPLAN